MEDSQKLKPELKNIFINYKNSPLKISIVNFPIKQKLRKLSNICFPFKLHIYVSILFIILICISLGNVLYDLLNINYEFEIVTPPFIQTSNKTTGIYDNNNFKKFLEVSSVTNSTKSSIRNFSKHRLRRNILNAKMQMHRFARNPNINGEFQIDERKKRDACKERYKFCQEILARIKNDVTGTKNAIHNLQSTLDTIDLNDIFSPEYLQCLECRKIERNSSNEYFYNNPINKTNLMNNTNIGQHINKEIPQMRNNISNGEIVLNSSRANTNIQTQNAPTKYTLQQSQINDNEDILTGPDSLYDVNTRNNENLVTASRIDYIQTMNNKNPLNTQLLNGTSLTNDHIDPRTIPEDQSYQPAHFSESKIPILPTAETMKTGQQLELTPTMPVLECPFCVYRTPSPLDYYPQSPSNIYPTSNVTKVLSKNVGAGQAQGFVPFQYANHQLPPNYPINNAPQSSPSVNRYNNQNIEPTGPGQNIHDIIYPGPFYCNFRPTVQFPSIPGDYQRSSGPANYFQPIKYNHIPSNVGNTWRNAADVDMKSFMSENSLNCKSYYRQCLDKSQCISRNQWCDGHVNCGDASDETQCSCKDRINKDRLCDGYFDCPYGEDEMGCFECPQDAFSCEDWSKQNLRGNCLTLEQRCDGVAQCRNGKDEVDCSALMDDNVDKEDIYTIGYSSGYLYRNYRGKWYQACTPTQEWAIESCSSETGTPMINENLPQIGTVNVKNRQPQVQFISKTVTGQILINPQCNNQAIYVNCPPIPCGTRIRSDYDRPRSSSKFEDILVASPHMISIKDQFNNSRMNESESKEQMEATWLEQERSSMDSRIVGGRASQPKAWPSIIAIYKDGLHKCGGVILNENWILTAAHCLHKHHTHYYRIHAGLLRRFSYSPTEQTRRAEFVVIHPDYNQQLMINDLGLIRLNESLRFNRWIRSSCLSDNSLIFNILPGRVCTTVGWGATSEYGPEPDHLREVEVPIVSQCNRPSDKAESMICAGSMEGGRDSCQGDSGGPMMCQIPGSDDQWFVAGIVSHGLGCGRPNEPGVYTNVSYFSPWIKSIISDQEVLVGPQPLQECPGFSCNRGQGKCLPRNRRCDQKVDCMDAEDEINCAQFVPNTKSSFKTFDDDSDESTESDNKPNQFYTRPVETRTWTMSTTSIPSSAPALTTVENQNFTEYTGTTDTTTEDITTIEPPATFEDLLLAASNIPIESPRFTCTRLVQTINLDARCNKIMECEDGTDEMNCTCRDILKNIYPTAICDGRTDCYDLTDEYNCTFCNADEFICIRSGMCIPLNKKCDKHPDCRLSEDEIDCFSLFTNEQLDADKRPAPGTSGPGTIITEVNGTWKTYCSDDSNSDNNNLFVDEICKYLGFRKSSWQIAGSKPNLMVLNKNLEENNESMVSLADLTFDIALSNETKECKPIIAMCQNTLINPATSYLYQMPGQDPIYMWPWEGAIFIEGKYHCPAILLNDVWFLTSLRCTENIDLNINATTITTGMSPAYKYVPGPYEKITQITNIIPSKEFNVSLLSGVTTETFNSTLRYTQPIFFEHRYSHANTHDECFATCTDSKFNTTTIPLQSITDNCPLCKRCFKKEIRDYKCKNGTGGDWSGIVTCRGSSGWYPAAVFHKEDIICGFQTPKSMTGIDQLFPYLMDTMDKYPLHGELPFCDGVRCKRGKCVPWQKVCDGIQDCEMGEDELDMNYCEEKQNLCQNSTILNCECSKSQLRCQNGECVPREAFCNEKIDCADGSDEPTECTCGEYLKLTAPERICDNIRHCLDKTDEINCTCKDTNYKCEGGNQNVCIPLEFICDGDKDCINGEDERHCQKIQNNPNSPDFAGEVLQRSYGIWHTQCYPIPITNDNQAQEICKSFGHSNGKTMTIAEAAPHGPATTIVSSGFFMIRLNKYQSITTREDKPLASLVQASPECHRAFIKCS